MSVRTVTGSTSETRTSGPRLHDPVKYGLLEGREVTAFLMVVSTTQLQSLLLIRKVVRHAGGP